MELFAIDDRTVCSSGVTMVPFGNVNVVLLVSGVRPYIEVTRGLRKTNFRKDY